MNRNGRNSVSVATGSSAVGSVYVDREQRQVTIEQLVLDSSEVYGYVSEQDDPLDAVRKAVETGAVALSRADSRTELDYVAKEASQRFASLEKNVIAFVERAVDPAQSGSLTQRVASVFRAQNDRVRDMIGKGDATMASLLEKLRVFQLELQDALQKSLEKSAVTEMLGQVKAEVANLRDAIVAQQARSVASSAMKGRSFEDTMIDRIGKWVQSFNGCAGYSAVLHDTRSESGALGKQGDLLLCIGTPSAATQHELRIALELKAAKGMTAPKAIQLLDQTKTNRSADASLLVGEEPDCLPPGGCWATYGATMLAVTADVVEVGIKYLLTQLLATQASQAGVRVENVLSHVDEAKAAMTRFASLVSSARSVSKTSGKVVDLALQIRSDVETVLDRLVVMLRSGDGATHDNAQVPMGDNEERNHSLEDNDARCPDSDEPVVIKFVEDEPGNEDGDEETDIMDLL